MFVNSPLFTTLIDYLPILLHHATTVNPVRISSNIYFTNARIFNCAILKNRQKMLYFSQNSNGVNTLQNIKKTAYFSDFLKVIHTPR